MSVRYELYKTRIGNDVVTEATQDGTGIHAEDIGREMASFKISDLQKTGIVVLYGMPEKQAAVEAITACDDVCVYLQDSAKGSGKWQRATALFLDGFKKENLDRLAKILSVIASRCGNFDQKLDGVEIKSFSDGGKIQDLLDTAQVVGCPVFTFLGYKSGNDIRTQLLTPTLASLYPKEAEIKQQLRAALRKKKAGGKLDFLTTQPEEKYAHKKKQKEEKRKKKVYKRYYEAMYGINFECTVKGSYGKGRFTGYGREFEVLRDSVLSTEEWSSSCKQKYGSILKELKMKRIIKGGVFVKDYKFNDPTTAAAIVSGSRGGYCCWMEENGTHSLQMLLDEATEGAKQPATQEINGFDVEQGGQMKFRPINQDHQLPFDRVIDKLRGDRAEKEAE